MNKQQEKEFDNMLKGYLVLTDGKYTIKKPRMEIKAFINKLIKEEQERTIKWAKEYIEADMKEYGTDKHGIALEDLIKFLKK